MEHHRPHQRHRDRRGHHRHREYRAQHAAQRELAMEDQRGDRAQDQREDHRQHGEIKRVKDRLEKALVGRELRVIVETDEMRDRADLPVERAHPDGERPGKDDDGADDDQRRHDEQQIAPPAPGEEAGAGGERRRCRVHLQSRCGCPRRRPDGAGVGVRLSRSCRGPAGTRRSRSSIRPPDRRR